jgi:hypothetical protein
LAAKGFGIVGKDEIRLLSADDGVNLGVEQIAHREGKLYVFQLAAMDDFHQLVSCCVLAFLVHRLGDP